MNVRIRTAVLLTGGLLAASAANGQSTTPAGQNPVSRAAVMSMSARRVAEIWSRLDVSGHRPQVPRAHLIYPVIL